MDEPIRQEALIPFGFEFGNGYLRDHHPSMCPNFRPKNLFYISTRHVYRMTFLVTLANREVCLVRAQNDQPQSLTRLDVILISNVT